MSAAELPNPTALIIEDDEDLSAIFADALTSAGYVPAIIADGALALGRVFQTLPALVVLDMHLPNVSGLHILRALRADERTKKMRVIVVSADALMTEEARQLADKALIKPVSFSLLRELSARLRPAH